MTRLGGTLTILLAMPALALGQPAGLDVPGLVARAEPSVACLLVSRSPLYRRYGMITGLEGPGVLGDVSAPHGLLSAAELRQLNLDDPHHIPEAFGTPGLIIDPKGTCPDELSRRARRGQSLRPLARRARQLRRHPRRRPAQRPRRAQADRSGQGAAPGDPLRQRRQDPSRRHGHRPQQSLRGRVQRRTGERVGRRDQQFAPPDSGPRADDRDVRHSALSVRPADADRRAAGARLERRGPPRCEGRLHRHHDFPRGPRRQRRPRRLRGAGHDADQENHRRPGSRRGGSTTASSACRSAWPIRWK